MTAVKMQLSKILETVEKFKHMNIVLMVCALFAITSGYMLVKYDDQRVELEAQRSANKDGMLIVMLNEKSNIDYIKDWLIEISKIYVRGLWLTKINYTEQKKELTISIRAIDQLDIYKYSSHLSGVLRGMRFCLLEVDVVKRGEKASTNNVKNDAKPMPFVLAFMAKRKQEKEKKEQEKNAIQENAEEELRWVYNYEADFKYGNCF
jgi:hypothetical protein